MKIKYLIDTHQHYGYWNTLTECKYNLLNSFTKYNLSYALISFDGSEFKEEGQKRGKLIPSLEGSKKMLKFVKENEHYGMLVWVRPHTENNVQEIESFIKKHLNLIHGIKFHPYCSRMRVTDKRFEPYILIARKYNLPILVHTAKDKYSSLKYLKRVAMKFNDVIFVAAHMELLTNNKNCVTLLKECNNVYCDTAWVNMDILNDLKSEGLLDRVMFGTDNPIDGLDTLNNQIYLDYYNNKIKLTKKELSKVYFENALKVYKIDKNLLKPRYFD